MKEENSSKTKKCNICEAIKNLDEYYLISGTQKTRSECKKCSISHDREYSKKVRKKYPLLEAERRLLNRKNTADKVFSHYGEFCICCNENNRIFLTIDHMENNGHEHRKEIRGNGLGHNFYLWLIRNNFPNEFQTLCRNCNWGKFRNYGVCPHEETL